MSAAQDALRELVRLKDLKDSLPALLNERDRHGYSLRYQHAYDEYDRCIPLAWEAARAALVLPPEGWVMVPAEPTEEMIAAGWIDKEDVNPDDIYRAMLAALPQPPGAK